MLDVAPSYSKHKLSTHERSTLQGVLDDVTYSCGSQLQELELGGGGAILLKFCRGCTLP